MVDRMQMVFDQKIMMGKPTVVHGEFEGDFTYELDVQIPPETFELQLHPNAEDFSDEVQEALKSTPAEATPR
jgi:hypothetical protein